MRLRQKFEVAVNIARDRGIGGIFNAIGYGINLITEPAVVRLQPILIQVEPTVDCNLKCKMCISPLLKTENKTLSLDGFRHLLGQFPMVRKISLVGRGEPLTNPQIFDIINYAKKRGILIGFATNATLMTQDAAKKIILSDVDWVNISLDGATKETYEQIRIGANFDVVINNIKNFIALLAKRNKPEVSIWFLAMKSNIEELPGLISLAAGIGVKNICVQTIHYWGSPDWKRNMLQENILDGSARLRQILSEASRVAKKKHVKFSYSNIPGGKRKRICQWPWKSCYITADGYVTPCCMHGSNSEIINFGNLFDKPFREIWNSVRYQDFRRALRSKSIPSLCVDCTSYYAGIKQ